MRRLLRSPEAIERTKLLFLGIAYTAVWIAITAYLFTINRRQQALEKRLKDLQDRALAEQSASDSRNENEQ